MNPRRAAIAGAVLAALMVVTAVIALSVHHVPSTGTNTVTAADDKDDPALPSLAGSHDWINTKPLSPADLAGKVVLVDFWDASCINCRRTFPFLRGLEMAYASKGLVIIGVHSPEFGFEKSTDYVTREAKDLGVTWPVLNDPDLKVWDSFQNQYWPATYLADRNGKVRLTEIGEGKDAQIEQGVRTLLNEGGDAGAATAMPEAGPPTPLTEERYLGAQRGNASIAEGVVPTGQTVTRHDDKAGQDEIGLTGTFTGADQYLVAHKGATVQLGFDAADVYTVVAPDGAGPVTVTVTLDGKPLAPADRGKDVRVLPDGTTIATVTQDDLYTLVQGSANRAGELALTVRDQPLRLFTFTFG